MNIHNDDFDWTIGSGFTTTTKSGPVKDHTRGTQDGESFSNCRTIMALPMLGAYEFSVLMRSLFLVARYVLGGGGELADRKEKLANRIHLHESKKA